MVTGGGRSLGRVIANGSVDAGATVAIIGRDADTLSDAAAELGEGAAGRAHPFAADVADEPAMIALAARIQEEVGTADVLVNNAGINPWYRRAEKTPMEEWCAVIDVNLSAVFHCS